jgi:hypothetical protein
MTDNTADSTTDMSSASEPRRPLFRPSARAINWLLVIVFVSLGYAMYLRYQAMELTSMALACDGGLPTWLCASRKLVMVLFNNMVFGWFALAVALLNLVRPSLILFTVALATAAFGLVMYNAGLSALAVGILALSFARLAPEPE